jgi:hypothetical protein
LQSLAADLSTLAVPFGLIMAKKSLDYARQQRKDSSSASAAASVSKQSSSPRKRKGTRVSRRRSVAGGGNPNCLPGDPDCDDEY